MHIDTRARSVLLDSPSATNEILRLRQLDCVRKCQVPLGYAQFTCLILTCCGRNLAFKFSTLLFGRTKKTNFHHEETVSLLKPCWDVSAGWYDRVFSAATGCVFSFLFFQTNFMGGPVNKAYKHYISGAFRAFYSKK